MNNVEREQGVTRKKSFVDRVRRMPTRSGKDGKKRAEALHSSSGSTAKPEGHNAPKAGTSGSKADFSMGKYDATEKGEKPKMLDADEMLIEKDKRRANNPFIRRLETDRSANQLGDSSDH